MAPMVTTFWEVNSAVGGEGWSSSRCTAAYASSADRRLSRCQPDSGSARPASIMASVKPRRRSRAVEIVSSSPRWAISAMTAADQVSGRLYAAS